MDDSLLITVSNLLTGQWEIFLTDPVSENKNEYCLIPKPRPFLYLIIHQEMTTSCSNRWTAITQHWYNAQQRIGHVTVQKNFRIINDIRAECYIYIYIYTWVSRSSVNEGLFGFTMTRIQLVLLAFLAFSISVKANRYFFLYPPAQLNGKVQTDCESFLQWLHLYLH